MSSGTFLFFLHCNSRTLVCGEQQTAHLGITATWGTNKYDALNDVVVTAHEIGHVLGSPHTHDSSGYDPVIDSCGTSTSDASKIPADGGSIMSYCHIVSGGKGWGSMSLWMGLVGGHGYQSERVNKKIRSRLEIAQCLTSPDPSWAPACPDTTTYTWNNGNPIICADEAAKGLCDKGGYMAPPNCMKSCNRCLKTTTPVIPNIPLTPSSPPSTPPSTPPSLPPSNPPTAPPTAPPATPVNCIWSSWSSWSACSVSCGGGTQTSTRKVQIPASGGGTDCSGSGYKTQPCNTDACTYTPPPPTTPPSTTTCDDVANPSVRRNGAPITCQTESLLGKCSEWYNQAPYCKSSCGWGNCPIPCDDLPNPYARVVSSSGTVLSTCAQQAKAGYCSYGWMNKRTCRFSCSRCSGNIVQPDNNNLMAGNITTHDGGVVTIEPTGDVVDTLLVLYDQGSQCLANKGDFFFIPVFV